MGEPSQGEGEYPSNVRKIRAMGSDGKKREENLPLTVKRRTVSGGRGKERGNLWESRKTEPLPEKGKKGER